MIDNPLAIVLLAIVAAWALWKLPGDDADDRWKDWWKDRRK